MGEWHVDERVPVIVTGVLAWSARMVQVLTRCADIGSFCTIARSPAPIERTRWSCHRPVVDLLSPIQRGGALGSARSGTGTICSDWFR